MFKPEKLLSGLLSGSKKSSSAKNLLTSGVGMAVLGVAIEAVDHYRKKSSAQAPPAYPGRVPPAAPGVSSFPTPGAPSAAPPPPPGSGTAASPPPNQAAGAAADRGEEAVLLIRAMIAAANADGTIDPGERQRILDRFKNTGLSPEEHTFLINELFSPADMETIASRVTTPELAREVYAVSLMAITVDTAAERDYIRSLGQRLGLPQEDKESIHQALGVENL